MAQKSKNPKKNPSKKPPPPPAAMGRPSIYTQELAEAICRELSQGVSLRSVCRNDWAPDGSTVFRWMREYPEFYKQYEAAKAESADAMAEDCLDISDNQVERPLLIDGIPFAIDGKIVMVKDQVSVAHAKLRVDTRKWLMAKMKPKKYGEKLELAGDKDNPIKYSVVERVIIDPKN